MSEPLSSADLLGVAPYRVYLISLQPYLYILSVALVLFAKANDGRYPLYCSVVSGLSSLRPKANSDKRPALRKGKTLLIIFAPQASHPNPFFYFWKDGKFCRIGFKISPTAIQRCGGAAGHYTNLRKRHYQKSTPTSPFVLWTTRRRKTTCARILAKKINSQNEQDSEQDFAFNIFELDAASNNSVEDIRNLNDQVRIPPQTGTHKVYIIDEVHMLSISAFNAFLKTLEEPPKHVIFILATTEKHKILPTILSRCQIF